MLLPAIVTRLPRGCRSAGGRFDVGLVGTALASRPVHEEDVMPSVARVTELSAKSETSFEDAIRAAVERATQTLRNVTSAWVKEQEVEISNGSITGYKVNLLVTFVLE